MRDRVTEIKGITPMQELFLEALFGIAKGDPLRAKDLAGYEKSVGMRSVMKGLSKDIIEDVSTYITLHSVKAAQKILGSLENPSAPGTANLLAAANSILDRAGIVKKDKLEVTIEAPTALLILPPKADKPD